MKKFIWNNLKGLFNKEKKNLFVSYINHFINLNKLGGLDTENFMNL